LVPDRGYAKGDIWYNIWVMNGDEEPGWSRYVDCQYRGSLRILRLKADGLKQCKQTVRPCSAAKGVAENAVQTMVCD
jgi:hypothetical protein